MYFFFKRKIKYVPFLLWSLSFIHYLYSFEELGTLLGIAPQKVQQDLSYNACICYLNRFNTSFSFLAPRHFRSEKILQKNARWKFPFFYSLTFVALWMVLIWKAATLWHKLVYEQHYKPGIVLLQHASLITRCQFLVMSFTFFMLNSKIATFSSC